MKEISVQMLEGGHPMMRFPMAFATCWRSDGGQLGRIFGEVDVSLETLEEAVTLRDVLSSFIAFHRAMPKEGAVQ